MACFIPIGVVAAAARMPLAADRPARGSAGEWFFPFSLTGFRPVHLDAQRSVEPFLDEVASPVWDIDGESLFRSKRRDERLPVPSVLGDGDCFVVDFDVNRTSVGHRKGSQDANDRDFEPALLHDQLPRPASQRIFFFKQVMTATANRLAAFTSTIRPSHLVLLPDATPGLEVQLLSGAPDCRPLHESSGVVLGLLVNLGCYS